MKIHIYITTFVLGIFLTVFAYQAYTIYELRSQVVDDHANLVQVINFLNTQIQAAQQQSAKATSQPVSIPTATSSKK